MRLKVTQDIAAPPERVFDRVADFAHFEERAVARGAEVRPLATDDGLGWQVLFDWHGARREVDVRVETIDRPRGYEASVVTRGVRGTSEVSVTPLEGGPTRLVVALDLGATSFAGQLVMQTLSFARPALEARLSRRLSDLAREIEAGA